MKKNLNDLKEQVYTALETKSTNNEITAMNEQLEQVSSNILLNTTSMNERALELDVHLKQFRTSLTDEIAVSKKKVKRGELSIVYCLLFIVYCLLCYCFFSNSINNKFF